MEQTIRVVLPMLTFVPGGMGGSETYAREVVAALARRGDLDLTILVPPAAAGIFAGVEEIVVERVTGGTSTPARVRSLAQATAPGARARAALARANVIHHLFTVPVPRTRGTPHVMSLLDVQHHDHPAMFGRAERAYRALAYDRPARRADRVITISEFAKRSIVEHLGISEERIEVAHLAVDRTWFTPADTAVEDFVYYPAAVWPHKNHSRLIAAMDIVRESRPELRLVLSGAGRERLGSLPTWVEHRGHVGRGEVRDLYQRAACLVFPSLYEGFGLPPLEAMASGCPVAAADAGALPEVCGDAAMLFDATNVATTAQAILRAIADRWSLRERGIFRAAEFDWNRCAAVHRDVYRLVAGR